jgi:hypothetical protein
MCVTMNGIERSAVMEAECRELEQRGRGLFGEDATVAAVERGATKRDVPRRGVSGLAVVRRAGAP